LFFFLFFSAFGSLAAEVESVTVTWTALHCKKTCIDLLQKQFSKIHGVQEILFNQNAGQVVLKWKKNEPFSFSPVNVAMELVGLTINDIRVRVKGKLQHTSRDVILVSTGDNTRFYLLNPVKGAKNSSSMEFNTSARQLQPELRKKLLDAEVADQIATIDGPLLFPERSPPLTLVVDRLSLANPEEES